MDKLSEKIKTNSLRLAYTLQVDTFQHLLKDHLQLLCQGIQDRKEKAKTLLTNLSNEEDCEHFCSVIAGIYPDLFELVMGRPPNSYESDYCIKPLMESLRQRRKWKAAQEDQFVPVRLKDFACDEEQRFFRGRYEEQCLRDDADVSLDDLEEHDLDREPVDLVEPGKRLVILGRAGAGKTKLAHHALDYWLDADADGFEHKKAVFLLDMKHLSEDNVPVTLSQLLTNQFDEACIKEYPQFQLWMKSNAHTLVIWLDNIDGLSLDPALRDERQMKGEEMLCHPLDWCFSILNEEVLPETSKIITSRSFAPPLELRNDHIIEMVGLSRKGIDDFISKNVLEEKQTKVNGILLNDPILMSMCEVPFWCSSLCKYLTQDDQRFTYTQIVAFLHLEYLKRLRDLLLGEDVRLYLDLLRERLLQDRGTHDHKLVFGDEDFRRAQISKHSQKEMERSGLLVCKETRDKFGVVRRKMEFYHFVVQEMLAAASLNECDIDVKVALSKLSPVGRLFYAGVALDKQSTAMSNLNKYIGFQENAGVVQKKGKQIEDYLEQRMQERDDDNVRREIVRITYEGQSGSLVQKTSQMMPSSKLNWLGSLQWLTAIDRFGLSFVSSATKRKSADEKGKDFRCNIGNLSQESLSRVEEAFNKHASLQTLHIDDSLGEEQIEPLICFMNERKTLETIRSTVEGNLSQLEVIKTGQSSKFSYYWKRGDLRILLPSEYLRDELKDWLIKESISSAIDVKDKKLVLFIPKGTETELRSTLEEKLQDLGHMFRDEFKIEVHHQPIDVVQEDGRENYGSGSQVCYHDANHKLHYATCGAFVKDEKGKLYMLTSCHGESPKVCYILEPDSSPPDQWKRYSCKRRAHVFKTDPLLDAILVEVNNEEVKNHIDPLLHCPHENSALCCVFTDRIDDFNAETGSWPVVVKSGKKGHPALGKLFLYDCDIPHKDITGALVVAPEGSQSFSEQGDSGSVIFQQDTHEHAKSDTHNYRLHEGLAMLSHGVTGLYPDLKCSLAFRLDHVIQYFSEKTGHDLHLLPLNSSQGDLA